MSASLDSTSASPQIYFHVSMYDLPRGAQRFGGWRVSCREAACNAWRSQAFARWVRGHASPGIFF